MATVAFKNKKLAIIPVVALGILAYGVNWVQASDDKEMVRAIDSGKSISLELVKPNYEIKVQGKQAVYDGWIQLDQLKKYPQFRQGFDQLLNINIVTENNMNGKSGCIYTDATGDRNGNTTLSDAFRNKTFETKYWGDTATQTKMAKLASKAYTDVSDNDPLAVYASINAYFNLLPDADNPDAFNGSQSLSREQFYTLAYKAENKVHILNENDSFNNAVGGKTEFTKYAQNEDALAYLNTSDKSLDGNAYRGSISRAEAIYLIVNQDFSKELSKVTGKETAFKDTKNAGDLALKEGFKYKDGDKQEIGKDRWQMYTLGYMLQNPNKGMDETLYKPMVVAKQLGLISGDTSRWDEPISKAEAIQLVANAQQAINKLNGYMSEAEYGKMNLNKFTESTEKPKVIGTTQDGQQYGKGFVTVDKSMVPLDPNTKLSSGLTLGEAKKSIYHSIEALEKQNLTMSEIDDYVQKQAAKLGTTIEDINRLDETTVTTSTPAKQQTQVQAPTKQTQTQSDSQTQQTQVQQAPASDGNAQISQSQSDFFKQHGGDPSTGSSSKSSNFQLGSQ